MTYECIVCFEGLSTQAPTTKTAFPRPDTSEAGNSRGKRKSPKKPEKPEDLKENCVTFCGHLFHRVCLNRWFEQNGKKNCPSCRKPLTISKIIRIFPPGDISDAAEEPESDGNTVAPRLSEIEEASIPKIDCSNQLCDELYQVHRTLVGDYNAIVEKYEEKCDQNDLLTAQNVSLEEECERLKKTFEESQSANFTLPKDKKHIPALMTAKPFPPTRKPRRATATETVSVSDNNSDDSSDEDSNPEPQKKKMKGMTTVQNKK